MKPPLATYRLQFSKDFGFNEAEKVIPYLSSLGISHIYASPIFRALSGSAHGYDVTDPGSLNPELGNEKAFGRMMETISRHRMDWIQDIVPNHMAISIENHTLRDVMVKGPGSDFADYYDIHWDEKNGLPGGKLLLPFLGDHYYHVLRAGKFRLRYGRYGITLNIYDQEYPLNNESYIRILKNAGQPAGPGDLDSMQALSGLIESAENDKDGKVDLKSGLDRLILEHGSCRELLERTLERISHVPPDEFPHLLHDTISSQHYLPVFWKTAGRQINFRRFFTINDLICINIEKDKVFRHHHSLILKYLENDNFQGLRIDHIDGLLDPAQYLAKIRKSAGNRYIVVEKILEGGERLPDGWPVQGTTGYDFLNAVNSLQVDSANRAKFERIYQRVRSRGPAISNPKASAKRLILERDLNPELERICRMLLPLIHGLPGRFDITFQQVRQALIHFLTNFPVYRSYVRENHYPEPDRQRILEVLRACREKSPDLRLVFDSMEKVLVEDVINKKGKGKALKVLMKIQQLTGPLMAKGVEDTLLYTYTRLLSLNEVGGDPLVFGKGKADFHEFILNRMENHPSSMNATSTHDTKRGEDVRARINVLSEIPGEWGTKFFRWSSINEKKKKICRGKRIPAAEVEYSIYQTLLGALPLGDDEFTGFIERQKKYFVKFLREGKVHSSWLLPDEDYEQAVQDFIERIFNDDNDIFIRDFREFVQKICFYGILNTLSQVTLKLTCPGIPDIYQGTELRDLNLVDPDNRRPVDYSRIAALASQLDYTDAGDLIRDFRKNPADERLKLFLIKKILRFRQNNHDFFTNSNYLPLRVGGSHSNHVLAFIREFRGESMIVAIPRLPAGLMNGEQDWPPGREVWRDTSLVMPDSDVHTYQNILTGSRHTFRRKITVAELFEFLPVCITKNSVE